VLRTISDLTGINITYDQALANSAALNQPYSIDIRQMSLEDVLGQVMQGNGLTFKVINPQTIFVYADNAQNRQRYEDQYTQTFYISHVDPAADIQPILQQLLVAGAPIPPRISINKSANAIVVRATAPMMQLIESIIRSNDRPRPEVMIEAEILEVDRSFIRKLGLDLSQYALGVTFSPELAPPNTASAPDAFPSMPPPFNANTVSRGVSPVDFYITSPTALVRLLESHSTTRVLAKPQSRGRDGQQMTLSLGDSIPIPTTTFNSAAAGGIANIPTTSVTYQEVGINLQFTPRVTYQDEVILDSLVLEKSGLGNFLSVAGQSFPTIVRRRSQGSIRLRDGESNLIAGLLRDDDRKTLRGFPGISSIPILRSLFGSTDDQVEQTDIVMIITPHIVRGHELTPEDLRPQYVGAGQTLGGSTPTLISPEAILGSRSRGLPPCLQPPPDLPAPSCRPSSHGRLALFRSKRSQPWVPPRRPPQVRRGSC
jgi:general secretion pathway protein D